MHIHLVVNDDPTMLPLLADLHPKMLTSYATVRRLDHIDSIAEAKHPRLIIDSGAYTAHTQGRTIHVPIYSCDSFSWRAPQKFGKDIRPGIPLPRWTESSASIMHTIRRSIERYNEMEHDATRLWATRGITWET